MSGPLPKFQDPPVIETVLGIKFKPITKWQVPHIGLYCARMRSQFPTFEVRPPMPDESEDRVQRATSKIRLNFGPPNPRCWLISRDGVWIIQVQNSQFFSNWRKAPGARYPEYKSFKEHFAKEWNRFNEFLKHEAIESPEPEQVEVSYINHIEFGHDFGNWSNIFPAWSKKTGEFLSHPDAVSINAVFPIEMDRGRLYIGAEPVIRHTDMIEVIQLTLTARVPLKTQMKKEIYDSFSLAHEWVVKGFADFTSDEMHTVWQRQQ